MKRFGWFFWYFSDSQTHSIWEVATTRESTMCCEAFCFWMCHVWFADRPVSWDLCSQFWQIGLEKLVWNQKISASSTQKLPQQTQTQQSVSLIITELHFCVQDFLYFRIWGSVKCFFFFLTPWWKVSNAKANIIGWQQQNWLVGLNVTGCGFIKSLPNTYLYVLPFPCQKCFLWDK